MKTPVIFCEKQVFDFIVKTSASDRKSKGQFFTPPEIARFMADMVEYQNDQLRILDPGAGAGILSCAVCEMAAKSGSVKAIIVDAYEDDKNLIDILDKSFVFTNGWLAAHNIDFEYNIIEQDFIQSVSQGLWSHKIDPYDIAISNPPYFKIGKDDPRAVAARHLVYGQPNIYALFMGVAAETLKLGGVLVFITPRSYSSGPYFKKFRETFFRQVRPERVHVFESRKDAFKKDDVLQENIILKARKKGSSDTIRVTVSKNTVDLSDSIDHDLSVQMVLHKSRNDLIFRIPVNEIDIETIETVEKWRGNLHEYGMQISTGPVVPFRATALMVEEKDIKGKVAPLIWMHHFHSMNLHWPSSRSNNGNYKLQHILVNDTSVKKRLLVSDQNMVLLRRFSAKEEKRRLIAAPFFKAVLGSDLVGLENHVNYIYNTDGKLTKMLASGLAALLNCSLFDRYFRISNGNTQVSATEMRAFPLPPIEQIRKIGERINRLKGVPSYEQIDEIVWSETHPD